MNLPDPITVAIALDNAIMTRSGFFHVDVETMSELTRGETVVDRYGTLGKPPNAHRRPRLRRPGLQTMFHRAAVGGRKPGRTAETVREPERKDGNERRRDGDG